MEWTTQSMILICPWLSRDGRDGWCPRSPSECPVVVVPAWDLSCPRPQSSNTPGARTSLSDRTVATLASVGQHLNISSMLYVVCDLVICCVHQQCSGQWLFQWCCCSLGQSSETTAAMGLYHHKKIIWSLDTDLQLCGRNEPNFILLWRLKCWEHAFWGIKHIHNSYDRNVTSV